jgi:hypothetical protein
MASYTVTEKLLQSFQTYVCHMSGCTITLNIVHHLDYLLKIAIFQRLDLSSSSGKVKDKKGVLLRGVL